MSLYYPPTPDQCLKSAAISVCSGSVFLGSLYDNNVWSFNGTAMVKTAASGAAGLSVSGYAQAATDGAGGFWAVQNSGALLGISSGSIYSAYALASGATYTGCAYNTVYAAPYVVSASGDVYTLVSGVMTGFSATTRVTVSGDTRVTDVGDIRVTADGSGSLASPIKSLTSSGSTLFSIHSTTPEIVTLTLSSQTAGTSGAISTPMTVPNCLSASTSASALAVGGYSYFTVASGFSSIASSPNFLTFAAVNSGTGIAQTWVVSGANTWAVTNSVSGLGNPIFVGWAPSGTNVLACDPVAGRVRSMSYSFGVLSLIQSITVAGACAVSVTPDSTKALVLSSTTNVITPMTFSASTWTSGTTFAGVGCRSVIAYSNTEAVIGATNSLNIVTYAGSWATTATGALGFTPSYLQRDSSGNIYAAGTSGGSGYFAVTTSGLAITASGSWTGSASGILLVQGQLVIGDPTGPIFRVFGSPAGSWSQQSTGVAPVGICSLAIDTQDVFAAGATVTNQYSFGAPFTLQQTPKGMVSIYKSGSWNSLTLSASSIPQSIAWDPSGNVSVSTAQNTLLTVSSGGTLLSTSGIAQQTGQTSTVPIGISSMMWLNGQLYGSTSLADALVLIR